MISVPAAERIQFEISAKRRASRSHSRCDYALLLLIIYSFLSTTVVNAQSAEINGRVVTEDGAGLSNMLVFLNAVDVNRHTESSATETRTVTDLDGNFRFKGLGQGHYSIRVPNIRGYVRKPPSMNERENPVFYRAGDRIRIIMIKGGSISGRVTNSSGAPLIGVQVNAVLARDVEGKPIRTEDAIRHRFTNDRGIYRIYGLQPGTYLVFARNNVFDLYPSPYDGDLPIYHPSSSRATALEVIVTSGAEAGGIDIRYRANLGNSVTGTVSGGKFAADTPAVSLSLFDLSTATAVGSNYLSPGGGRGFTFSGLPEGEYAVIARTDGDDSGMASEPRRISIKGKDITDIVLKLLPLGSINGRVFFERSPELCAGAPNSPPQGISPVVIRDDHEGDELAFLRQRDFPGRLIDEKGSFAINDVDPGFYRIGARLADENYYVKTIKRQEYASTRKVSITKKSAVDISREGFEVKRGEKVSGFTVIFADGAAGLNGKVIAENSVEPPAVRLRAHLIPAEHNAANEVFRYIEALVKIDGTFTFSNIAPGRYLLHVRPANDDDTRDRAPAPVAPGEKERAKLRRETEAQKLEVELKPCQRLKNQSVKYPSKQ